MFFAWQLHVISPSGYAKEFSSLP